MDTLSNANILRVLKGAKARLVKGWVKEHSHLRKNGRDHYCLSGAIDASTTVFGRQWQVRRVVEWVLPKRFRRDIIGFNDDPKTRKKDVIGVLNLAIKGVKTGKFVSYKRTVK